MSSEIPLKSESEFTSDMVKAVQDIADNVKSGSSDLTKSFDGLTSIMATMQTAIVTALNQLKINITNNFKSASSPIKRSEKEESKASEGIFSEKFDKYFSQTSKETAPIVESIKPILETFGIMQEQSAKADDKVPISGYSDVYKIFESTLIDDAKKSGDELYAVLEPVYSVSETLKNSFDDISKAINPSIGTYEIITQAFIDVEDVLKDFSSNVEELSSNLPKDVFGIAQNQSQPSQTQKYSGGETYGVIGNNKPKALPTMFAREFEVKKEYYAGRPGTSFEMPTFKTLAKDFHDGAKVFGEGIKPFFGFVAQSFGKKLSPLIQGPLVKGGMDIMKAGAEYSQRGEMAVGGKVGAAVGGGATALLGAGIAGFGVALNAVTAAANLAGGAIQSMAMYVGKFNPAAVEQMNIVFNDLQGVIGRALLPIFQMAIPIVRQFADFVNFAVIALQPVMNVLSETFQTLVAPLMELATVLVDAFAPVLVFVASIFKGLAMILEPIINGFSMLFETISMMFGIFTGGIDITKIMMDGFKLLADIVNVLVGAFNWVVAAFYAGVGTLLKVLADAVDWIDGPGRGRFSEGLMEMGDEAIEGGRKLATNAEKQMEAGIKGEKFSYKAGSIKGFKGIESGSSVGAAVREAQSVSIAGIGDEIRKSALMAVTAQQGDGKKEPEKKTQEQLLQDIAGNLEPKNIENAVANGFMRANQNMARNQVVDFGAMDTSYSGGGGDFGPV